MVQNVWLDKNVKIWKIKLVVLLLMILLNVNGIMINVLLKHVLLHHPIQQNKIVIIIKMVVQLKYLVDVDLKQHVQMQQLKLHVQHQ